MEKRGWGGCFIVFHNWVSFLRFLELEYMKKKGSFLKISNNRCRAKHRKPFNQRKTLTGVGVFYFFQKQKYRKKKTKFFSFPFKFQRGGHQVKFPAGALDTRAKFALSWFILELHVRSTSSDFTTNLPPAGGSVLEGILVLLRMQMWLLPKYIFIDYINRSLLASLCTLGLCTNICIFTIYTVSLVRQVLNCVLCTYPICGRLPADNITPIQSFALHLQARQVSPSLASSNVWRALHSCNG